jgi:hypothetical protein
LERQSSLANTTCPRQRQHSTGLNELFDIANLSFTTYEACGLDGQVSARPPSELCILFEGGPQDAPVTSHRHDCVQEAVTLAGRQVKGVGQPLRGVAVWVRCPAFELLDSIDTQSSPFGQEFLSQSGRGAVLAQQSAERLPV